MVLPKVVFSTSSYSYLLGKILEKDDFEKGEILRKTFPDGEHYARIITNLIDRKVTLLGGTQSDTACLELYDTACGLVEGGCSSLEIIIPYFGYSTMERATKKGEIVMAKARARLLSSMPSAPRGNKITMIDLHSEGIPHYFEGAIRTEHLYAKPLILKAARDIGGTDFVLACTDSGRAKWVESLANDLGVSAAFVFKKRISGKKVEVTGVNADVKGKKVVIYDDMIRTGGTLIKAAQAYHEAGAEEIFAITTHGLFSGNCLQKIEDCGLIKRIVSTDTHPVVQELNSEFVEVRSIAPLIKDHIKGHILL